MKMNFFLLGLLSLLLSSCGDELLKTDNQRNPEFVTKSTLDSNILMDEKCSASYYVNNEGALVFSTLDDYGFLIDSISKLTDDDFVNWENRINFKSYRTFTDNLIENTESLEMLQSLYPEFFEKNEKYDVVLPKIQAKLYRSIVNKEGIFYIGDTKNKVEDDCFSVEGKNVNPVLRQKISYSLGNESQIGNAIEYPSIEYVSEKTGYKVMSWFRIYKIRGTNGSQTYYSTVLEITVRPRSWGALVGWNDTNSTCHVEEVKMKMKGLGGCMFYDEEGEFVARINEFMALKTVSSSSASKLWTLSIHIGMSDYDSGVIQDPYCVHYRARIDKIGKFGAAYNTHHPESGIGGACSLHRQVTEYQNVIYDK